MRKCNEFITRCLSALLCGTMLSSMMACGKVSNNAGIGSTKDVQIRIAHSADKILQDVDYEDADLLSEFSLSCFRNEYESGQLILTALNDISEYEVSVGTFSNGKSEIPSEVFEIYHEYYHEVESIYDAESTMQPGMYPDALIPFETAVEKGLNSVKQGDNQGVWVAVKVPKEQEAGTYTGTFQVTVNNKKVEVPATIEVVDYTLPDKVSLKSCYPIQVGYMFNGELDDTQEMYEKHLDTLNRFRLSGQYLSSYLPEGDYDAYDYGVYDANLAVKYHAKDSCASYAIRVIESAHPVYPYVLNEPRFLAYLKAYIDVGIQNNVNLFDKAYVFMGNICDEPTLSGNEAGADYAATQFQNCLKEAATYLEGQDCDASLKENMKRDLLGLSNVVTGELSEKMPTVNTYCPTVDHFGSEMAEVNYSDLRDIGKDYWFYTCTVPKIPYPTHHLDDNAVSSRVMGWMAKDYDVSGYLTWEVVYYMKAGAGPTVKVYGQELYDDVHRWGDAYGDGFYVYPGKVFDLDEPVVSLRLFTICDGMEDYEALLDLENSYKAIAEKSGVTTLSADSVLQVLYSTLYSNARVYSTSAQVQQAKETLAQLLILAKNQEIAIEKASVEGTKLELSVVAPKATELVVTGEKLDATETVGEFSRYAKTIDLSALDKSTVEIKGGEIAVVLSFGNKLKLIDDFENNSSLTVAGMNNAVVTEERNGVSVATVNLSGKDNYTIICPVEKNTITSKTESMNIVVYNNGSQREKMTVYLNGQIVLDSVYMEPGKNVYHFSNLQKLNWATLKTVNNIVFQITGDTSRTQSVSFDSVSVFTD